MMAWLAELKCGALLAPLAEKFGAETFDDLMELDAEDIQELIGAAGLKKVPAKKLAKAHLALRGGEGSPPSPLPGAPPEGVPVSDEDVEERLEVFARAIDARDAARVRAALAPLTEPAVGGWVRACTRCPAAKCIETPPLHRAAWHGAADVMALLLEG